MVDFNKFTGLTPEQRKDIRDKRQAHQDKLSMMVRELQGMPLSAWEQGFARDMQEQRSRHDNMTDRQQEHLLRVYSKYR